MTKNGRAVTNPPGRAPGREFLHYNVCPVPSSSHLDPFVHTCTTCIRTQLAKEETSLNGHEVKIIKSDRLNLDASTIFTCLRPSKKALPLSRRITNGAVMPRASEGVKVKPQPLFCRGDSASQTERGYRCTLPSYLQRANGGSSDATSKGLDDAQLAEAVGTKRCKSRLLHRRLSRPAEKQPRRGPHLQKQWKKQL